MRASDGKVLWHRRASKGVPSGNTHHWNGYASASCATDGKYVFAFFGTPGLFCYDLDGKLLWKHSFGVFTSKAGWGTAASPFLFEDLVIQNCDNDGASGLPKGSDKSAAPMALVALEKATGKVRWQTPRNQGRGFSTPRLVKTPSGRVDLVLNGPLGVWGYDPRSGKEVWHCDRTDPADKGRFGEPMPVSDATTLYAPSGRPGPFQAIRLGGSGDVTRTHLVWQVRSRATPRRVVANSSGAACSTPPTARACSPVTTPGQGPWCLRSRSAGARNRSGRQCAGRQAAVRAGRWRNGGARTGRTLKVVARNRLGDGKELDFNASPAIADGKLYLRSQSHLYCIGKK